MQHKTEDSKMKKVAWKKGLFRIYLILGAIGLIFAIFSIMPTIEAKRYRGEQEIVAKPYMKLCRDVAVQSQTQTVIAPILEQQLEKQADQYWNLHDKADKAEKTSRVLLSLASLLIVGTWIIHWFIEGLFKFALLPIYRWVQKGFRAE